MARHLEREPSADLNVSRRLPHGSYDSVNPNVWHSPGSRFGAEKYGLFSRLIASTRIWSFIPSRIRKFFEMPTSNFRNRWLRNCPIVSGKYRSVFVPFAWKLFPKPGTLLFAVPGHHSGRTLKCPSREYRPRSVGPAHPSCRACSQAGTDHRCKRRFRTTAARRSAIRKRPGSAIRRGSRPRPDASRCPTSVPFRTEARRCPRT